MVVDCRSPGSGDAKGDADFTRYVEELTAEVARLRETLQAKDRLMATVAHELRQPIHAAVAALYLLHAPESGTRDRARAVAERQLQQMSRLAEDLLDASQAEP